MLIFIEKCDECECNASACTRVRLPQRACSAAPPQKPAHVIIYKRISTDVYPYKRPARFNIAVVADDVVCRCRPAQLKHPSRLARRRRRRRRHAIVPNPELHMHTRARAHAMHITTAAVPLRRLNVHFFRIKTDAVGIGACTRNVRVYCSVPISIYFPPASGDNDSDVVDVDGEGV